MSSNPVSSDSEAAFDGDPIVAETFVRQIRYHEIIDSTNNAAFDDCQVDDLQTPLLVLAACQTAGRGRGSNPWWSARGALTFSLVIRPADLGLGEQRWPQASLTTGLAVCFALDQLLPDDDVLLKWPNDVYVRQRKVAGVLVEVGPRPTGTLVIGIGVNGNNSVEAAPAELRSNATSLVEVTGQEFDLSRILIGILQQLETQLARLSNDDAGLAADWQQRCTLVGKTVQIDVANGHTKGVCQGIDAEGALVVQTVDGPARFFSGIVAGVW
ncbi:MAG: biotin--[acetyl-CoA-carboxylase] ligase [Planctomycetota bacterium]|nr:biotin--[acetyl-CoA-carboxylase] ligase [Planctomycetota bacterium]